MKTYEVKARGYAYLTVVAASEKHAVEAAIIILDEGMENMDIDSGSFNSFMAEEIEED